jgi:nanoRNase/pAp phosphatase (c-di-AMP/oligoRNAs hydrolase)
MTPNQVPRSDRLLESLEPAERVVVLTHTNPDPDAIASAWGIAALIEARTGKTARVIADGSVQRSENLKMIELLQPPLKLSAQLERQRDTAIVMTDCNPGGKNHLLRDRAQKAIAVIDHHYPCGDPFRVSHRDIRTHIVASATIVTEYMREQDFEPPAELATALLYAIQTDSMGQASFSKTDHRAVAWLTERADLNTLAQIHSAPRDRDYFGDVLQALTSTFVYEDSAVCFLPQANAPEVVAEVADQLIRCEGLHRVLCMASVGGNAIISVRTNEHGGHAGNLVSTVIDGIGHGGGHRNKAGGALQQRSDRNTVSTRLQSQLRQRWLSACSIRQSRGSRLVARRNIMSCL